MLEHEEALQAIADANGGTRAAGTTGYTESVDYVVDTLEAAGWNVELDEFDFTFVPPPLLEQLTPVAAEYESGTFTGTGYGEVTGNVIPVDIVLDLPRDPVTSGCEAADFAGIDWSGDNDIALIQRGTCEFGVKAINAQTAGAEAVIIFNQGNTRAALRPRHRHAVRHQPDAAEHPGRRCELRRRRRARAGRTRPRTSWSTRPSPVRRST